MSNLPEKKGISAIGIGAGASALTILGVQVIAASVITDFLTSVALFGIGYAIGRMMK